MKKEHEFDKFNAAMGLILRADPKAVKAGMQAEKRNRAAEAELTGKRGRGRPPKRFSSSAPSSSNRDA